MKNHALSPKNYLTYRTLHPRLDELRRQKLKQKLKQKMELISDLII